MIVVKLQGGLGNQLFQYALGRHLSLKNKTPLKLDASALDTDVTGVTKRSYSLGAFTIQTSFATKDEVAWFEKYRFKTGRMWFWYNRIRANRSRYVWEERASFEPWILTLKEPAYLDGWWQCEKYFKDIRAELLADLKLQNPLSAYATSIAEEIAGSLSVSVHVRRGDYVSDPKTNEWMGTCSPDYYTRAIQEIKKRFSTPHFFIFSDDLAWARATIATNAPTTYVEGNTRFPHEDLSLMSQCQHTIVANSSFSWWGAWLNTNPTKVVIAPKKWFQTPKMATSDIVPDSWVTL